MEIWHSHPYHHKFGSTQLYPMSLFAVASKFPLTGTKKPSPTYSELYPQYMSLILPYLVDLFLQMNRELWHPRQDYLCLRVWPPWAMNRLIMGVGVFWWGGFCFKTWGVFSYGLFCIDIYEHSNHAQIFTKTIGPAERGGLGPNELWSSSLETTFQPNGPMNQLVLQCMIGTLLCNILYNVLHSMQGC